MKGILPFSILKDRFQLSKSNFYQYLQIRHALQSQALTFQFQYNPSEILLKATLVRLSKRGLIGDLYHIFLNTVKGDGQAKRLIRWQKDLIDLNEDEWTRAMEILPEVSISPSQQLTQLFILHRTHYTPQKLFVWGKNASPLCPRCLVSNGSLIHMLWRCPKLHRYWEKVFMTLNTIL